MATAASELLRAVRGASLASRIAAAEASRAATVAPRSSRAAAAAASRAARLGLRFVAPLTSLMRYASARGNASTKLRDDASSNRSSECFSSDDDVPDDAKIPSDKDVESDEALWTFYERWCKAFNKERDHAETARRFKIFRHYAEYVHHFNRHLPEDPEEAAIWVQKRREAGLLLSRGEDVSGFDECHLPIELGKFDDGGDPFISELCKHLLEGIEKKDQLSAAEDVTAG